MHICGLPHILHVIVSQCIGPQNKYATILHDKQIVLVWPRIGSPNESASFRNDKSIVIVWQRIGPHKAAAIRSAKLFAVKHQTV